jgi:hypothetical protein
MAYILNDKSKPVLSVLTTSDVQNIATDEDITINTNSGDVEAKTIYFKKENTDDAVMEIVTKDSDSIEVNSQIKRSDDLTYYVQSITPPQVKFGTGTPLLSQTTTVSFPTVENKAFAPEKIATFLIFKK